MWNKIKQRKIFYLIVSFALLAVVGSFIVLLGLSTKSFDNNLAATDMLGQYDTSDPLNPTPIYTKGAPNNSPNPLGVNAPKGQALYEDYYSGAAQIFVSDSNNNRILVYGLTNHHALADYFPDYVLGQSSFYTDTSGTTDSTLNNPTRLLVDRNNGRLFVSDTGNNRILVFDFSNGLTNGESAIAVLGQPDFTSSSSGLSDSSLNNPIEMTLDPNTNFLYVADSYNNRVMVFDVATITNGESAVNVLGQPDFVSNFADITSSTMNAPSGISINPTSSVLYVADSNNNRILAFDVASIIDGENAINVLGQPDFTSNGSGLSDTELNHPHSANYFFDTSTLEDWLFVSDKDNHRVIVYNVTAIADGEAAMNVIGQEDFTSSDVIADQDGMNTPEQVLVNTYEDPHIWVSDSGFHRVFSYNPLALENGMDGEGYNLIGQYDESIPDSPTPIYTKSSPNNGPNRLGFYSPSDIAIDETNHRLFLVDGGNNRVLVYNLDTDNLLLDHIPDYVLGQNDFNTSSTGTTSSTLNGPFGVEFDPVHQRIFIADSANNRILVFDASSIVSGQSAVAVLGQTDLTSSLQAYSATGLSGATGLAYDSVHDRLFATSDGRVLVYDTATIVNGEAAINIIGQADFSGQASVVTQSGVKTPFALAYDSERDLLFVGDSNAYRITVYDTATITNGENAVYVLGAPDFTTRVYGTTQSKVGAVIGLVYYNGRLFASDGSRVLLFDVNEIVNSENAINVFGQNDFTSSDAHTNQNGFSYAEGLAYSTNNDYFYVVDTGNNRAMIFDLPPAPGITLSASSITLTEGNNTTFTIVLSSPPAGDVTLNISSTDTTEGTVASASIVFTSGNWNVPQTITITAPSDGIIDGPQNYSVIVSVDDANSDNEYDPIPNKILALTTNDDGSSGGGGGGGGGSNQPGINVIHTNGGTSVVEGATDTFTVSLKSNITSDVVLSISSTDPSEGAVFPPTLTFSNNNWNSPQTITLTGVFDGIADGTQTYNIIISVIDALSNDSYDGVADVIIPVSTIDNGDNNDNGDVSVDPDIDHDGIPNTSDPDIDGDGIPNKTDPDTDGDGIPNTTDQDDDNDGTTDSKDSTPTGPDGEDTKEEKIPPILIPDGQDQKHTPPVLPGGINPGNGGGTENQDPNSNPDQNPSGGSNDNTGDSGGIFSEIVKILSGLISGAFAKIVVALGATSAVALGFVRLIFTNPFGITDLAMRGWSMFLYGFGIKKRHKPWGVVFDSITKQPLDPVYLKLVDIEKKVVGTCFTDIDGRYGFLVEPGHYHIIAEKTHYVFPSSKLNSKERDEVYTDLYYGNYIEIKELGQVITKNIPMDRVGFDWNEYAKLEQHRLRWYKRSDKAVGQIIDVFFLVGFIMSGLTLLGNNIKPYNVIIFAVYGILFAFNHTEFGNYAKGKAMFKAGSPIAYGILRVFSKENGREITHKIIDRLGNYFCLAPNGHYNISIEQKNPDGSYSKIHSEEGLEITKGYLKKEFKV